MSRKMRIKIGFDLSPRQVSAIAHSEGLASLDKHQVRAWIDRTMQDILKDVLQDYIEDTSRKVQEQLELLDPCQTNLPDPERSFS